MAIFHRTRFRGCQYAPKCAQCTMHYYIGTCANPQYITGLQQRKIKPAEKLLFSRRIQISLLAWTFVKTEAVENQAMMESSAAIDPKERMDPKQTLLFFWFFTVWQIHFPEREEEEDR